VGLESHVSCEGIVIGAF